MGDENLKTLGIVVRALRSLTEMQGITPQQILSYINTKYNIPKDRIKRQLGSILKRIREFGILKGAEGRQKPTPKNVLFVTERRPCCKCTDCTGACGYCEKKGDGKQRRKMCRSNSACGKRSKRSKMRKRDSCRKKRKSRRRKSKRSCGRK